MISHEERLVERVNPKPTQKFQPKSCGVKRSFEYHWVRIVFMIAPSTYFHWRIVLLTRKKVFLLINLMCSFMLIFIRLSRVQDIWKQPCSICYIWTMEECRCENKSMNLYRSTCAYVAHSAWVCDVTNNDIDPRCIWRHIELLYVVVD